MLTVSGFACPQPTLGSSLVLARGLIHTLPDPAHSNNPFVWLVNGSI